MTVIPNTIPNVGVINYQYQIDPSLPANNSNSSSNVVITNLNNADLKIVKAVDVMGADIGDVLLYTLVVTNSGNAVANQVTIIDTIPEGTNFISNSVIINNVPSPSTNPQTGIALANVPAGGSSTITFNVQVYTIPTVNPIPNTASLDYFYTVDPSVPNGKHKGALSNTVTVPVSNADVYPVKAVDKTFATVGDTLTYTITLSNSGNVPAFGVMLYDTIPTDTNFVLNSVYVNGVNQPGVNPQSGVQVGTIPAYSSIDVKFQVVVPTIPIPDPIPNNANLTYKYTVVNVTTKNVGKQSNTVNTQVNLADIFIGKQVDKKFVDVNSQITYTLTLTNSGNVKGDNVVVFDTIPKGATFVPGSVTVKGVQMAGVNPETGISIGSLGAGETITVTFKIMSYTLPCLTPFMTPCGQILGGTVPQTVLPCGQIIQTGASCENPLLNKACTSYNFMVDTVAGSKLNGGMCSNVVQTTVVTAILETTKKVSTAYSDINQEITYTITFDNKGNTPTVNTFFFDTIPTGTVFVPGSVTLNNSILQGANPQAGILIGSVNPYQPQTLTFRVKINTIPNPNPIKNQGVTNYSYEVDTTINEVVDKQTVTNVVCTQVNNACIYPTKATDKNYAYVGETITYTIKLTNLGNTNADNIVLIDTIPNFTTFIPGSVIVNGVSKPASNPNLGIQVGTISPSQNVEVSFKVKATAVPDKNPINNEALVNFNYTVDPANVDGVGSSERTNVVSTTIVQAVIETKKSVDNGYVDVDEVLTYTIEVKNTGNTVANNVVIYDTIPLNTQFIENSVEVNGAVVIGDNPLTGIFYGSLQPGEEGFVTFKVRAISLPKVNPIQNTANISFAFTTDPSTPNGNMRNVSSNIAPTTILSAFIMNEDGGLVKSVNSSYGAVNDILTYSVLLKNTGNTDANNVTIYDPAPNGTEFVKNSLKINGVPIVNGDPSDGYNVGKIIALNTVMVEFKVRVLEIPIENPILNKMEVSYVYTSDPQYPNGRSQRHFSNTVSTLIQEAIISNETGGLIKNVDKDYGVINDIITYSIALKNTGNTTATNVILKDTIPNNTAFVSGSVIIDGIPMPGGNPQTGVMVPDIPANSSRTVMFKVQVLTLPSPNPIPNKATVNYSFTSNPTFPNSNSRTNTTNTVETEINIARIDKADGGLIKSADKSYVKVGEEITYTIALKNTGNVDAINVVFMDSVPLGTELIPNSVEIDNVIQSGYNPENGFVVGTVKVGQTRNVSFKVLVNSLPVVNPIPNTSRVTFDYIYNPNTLQTSTGSGVSNEILTTVNEAYIRNEDGGLVKTSNKNYVAVGDKVTYTINLKNTGNVAATGVKLIDTLPDDVTFVGNSVKVNGISSNANPNSGIQVGNLAPGQQAQVTFDILITTIPKVNPIPNSAKVSYRFTKDPFVPNGEYSEYKSNQTLVKVNEARITNADGGLIKSVDKEFADIGEIVTYGITMLNTGNTTANNVVLFDTVPEGMSFIDNSVTVNGMEAPAQTPETGVIVGNIAPNGTAIVLFKCKVINMPNNNPTVNKADVAYTFIYDPITQGQANRRNTTNPVNVLINHAEIAYPTGGLTKSVDKLYADVNEEITYTIKLINTGNVQANNVIVTDTIADGAKFVPNSVTVNGNNVLSANPQTGIFIDTIMPMEVVLVSFKVVASTIPVVNPLPNKSGVSYSYTVDPSKPDGTSANNTSNTVTTQINTADLSEIKKSGTLKYADYGDTITYTVSVKNNGNVAATNVSIIDTVPNNVQFISDSIKVNGNTVIGVVPGQNIGIGVINPNEVATVTFMVKVVSIPNDSAIENFATVKYNYTKNPTFPNGQSAKNRSNIFVTTVMNATISNQAGGFTKKVSKAYADVSDVLTYTFYLENTGNTVATNVILTDTIGNGMKFIDNSASVNGIIALGENPEDGITVGNIAPNEIVTVSFNVQITNIPSVNPIPDIGVVNYDYTVDPESPNGKHVKNLSNQENVQVNHGQISNIDGGLTKTANKTYVQIGDVITYTITMKNTGNVATDNVTLQDTLPGGTELIPSSILLNSVPILGANPQVGINIGTIKPGATSVLSFKVVVVSIADTAYPPMVNGVPCMSGGGESGILENTANVCYRYTVDPSKPCGKTACNQSNTNKIKINTAIVDILKESTPTYVDLNGVIDFKLSLKNTGNVLGDEILVQDILAPVLSFVPNSVKINGINQPGISILNGISVAPMQPYDSTTIEFKATVTSIPSFNKVENSAKVSYSFVLNPENGTKGSSTDTSNITENYVNHGELKAVKAVDNEYAGAGETLNYTITLTNTGNTKVNNVELYDTLPDGVKLIQGSVIINGVTKPGAVPQYGIFIGTLNPGAKTVITYKGIIDKSISVATIVNTATANYSYTVDPTTLKEVDKTVETNEAETFINDAIISNETGSFIKSTSKDVVDIGDVYTYTIFAKNIGTVSANNVVVFDDLENYISYVKGTLEINGVAQPDTDLSLGIPVGVIEPQNAVTIVFDVLVNSIPESGIIRNSSTIDFSYIKNPVIPVEVSKEEVSNFVDVKVISGNITNVIKTPDKSYAKIGDSIKFTITGTNTGNVDLTNILVKDKLNSSYQFVKDSVTVNGLLRLNENIESGVIIASLPTGKSFTITFKVVVVDVNNDQKISNKAEILYSYNVGGNEVNKTSISTDGSVLVRQAELVLEKLGSASYAEIGDIISFYLTVQNTGNVIANNVQLEDVLPAEIEFVVGSVEVNSNSEPIANIVDGITLENINPMEMVIVKFEGKVISIPDSGEVVNIGYIKYNYVVDPTKPPVPGASSSNEVSININSTNIQFTKGIDTQYAAIGDIVTFDFQIANYGNITANNVIFFDTLPKELGFIENSVIVNGIPVPEVDPTQGINIGTIAVDEDINIKFKVKVNGFGKSDTFTNIGVLSYTSKINPNEAQTKSTINSNVVQVVVRSPHVTIVKDSNYHTAIVGDKIHYTIKVNNSGNIDVENLSIIDILASNLSFVSGSVTINGNAAPSANPSKGILIKTLSPAETDLVEFDAIIVASSLNTAQNTSTAYYNYYVNPTKAPREGKATSNENIIVIENVDLTVTKSANKTVVVLDDVITYTVEVVNNGSVSASNVEFVDSLPNTVTIVPGSFMIDGVVVNGVDVQNGVNIGNIPPKTSRVVSYSVTVENVDCSGLVTNYAYVLFNVNVAPDAPVRRVQATPSSLSIRAASPRFKEMNIDKVLSIPCKKPDVEDINEVQVTAEVTDFYVIKTIKGISSDGKRLTGYKLVVNGLLNYSVEYTAAVCSQSVHSAQYCEKFSSYIIIDEGAIPSPLANVVADIEDVSWQLLDPRSVFANVTMNVLVK
ncbi:MAG: DUF7507 domain-containing protein [Clostridium sp.]